MESSRSAAVAAALAAGLAAGQATHAGEDVVLRVSVRVFERPLDYPDVAATSEAQIVDPGQDFVVKILLADLRQAPDAAGVFSSYVDVNFSDPRLATLVPALPGVLHPQTGNPTPYRHNVMEFGNASAPVNGDGLIDTDMNGSLDQIDVLGSFASNFSGSGPGEFVLVEFAMTAEAPGSLTITPESTTEDPAVDPDDAGESPLFDTTLFGQVQPVCPSQSKPASCIGEIEFVPATIAIGDEVFSNGFETSAKAAE